MSTATGESDGDIDGIDNDNGIDVILGVPPKLGTGADGRMGPVFREKALMLCAAAGDGAAKHAATNAASARLTSPL